MAMMGRGTRACVIALVMAQAVCVLSMRPVVDQETLVAEPKAPQWPKSYTVEYTLTLPYTAKLQPDPLRCASSQDVICDRGWGGVL